jgi:hypothetical protein
MKMSFQIGRLEHRQTRLTFALLLRDRLSLADALVGNVGVTAGPRTGWRKNYPAERWTSPYAAASTRPTICLPTLP